ncbi:MAG TPA: hypothetical protein VNF04_01405 [Stellaceae bacterium]|nr:hypothetical protein [Stellaceae bacterium]
MQRETLSHKRYADTQATAEYMNMSAGFLEKARVTGTPKIPFLKIGRSVRYDLDQIDAFMGDRSRFNTSEAA